MKCSVCIALCGLAAGVAGAQTTYVDAVGNTTAGGDIHDFFHSQGFTHLDIASVDVWNDSTNVYFDINMVGDIDATAWGKYLVGIDTGANAGDNSTDPGSWNRNVDWGRGITDLLGTWADDGGSGMGGELRQFDGVAWGLTDATYAAGTLMGGSDAGHAAGTQHVWVNFAALGLTIGDTFEFDVFSTGGTGGDPGVDHLSQSGFSTDDWGNTSTAGNFLSYTLVPAPSTAALLGLGGLVAVRRRR